MLELVLVASATTLATGLGVIPVAVLGERAAELRGGLLGLAAGVMLVAAVAGLLLPALDEGTDGEVAIGLAAGVAFLLVARTAIDEAPPGAITAGDRTWVLVFLVLFVHSLPEGFAIGTAYASATAGLGLFIVVAIAVQNIPEGTSTAIPMATAGYGFRAQFWAAVLTSVPQPVGAVVAYLLVEQITALLPVSFAFAAGAMLALVVVSVFPDAWRERRRDALAGAAAGGALMVALSAVLGV
ncbi:MAG TPA: ZIP family metal transporter [Solirubrobacterales bacterium]|nr:ZIP family metal transporter [Solirubrobacterales bacterium]